MGPIVGISIVGVLLWFLFKRKRKDNSTEQAEADVGQDKYVYHPADSIYQDAVVLPKIFISRNALESSQHTKVALILAVHQRDHILKDRGLYTSRPKRYASRQLGFGCTKSYMVWYFGCQAAMSMSAMLNDFRAHLGRNETRHCLNSKFRDAERAGPNISSVKTSPLARK